jgi:hypothetical protein
VNVVGLYIGTNGVGFTVRVRSGLSRQAKHLIWFGFLVFIAASLAVKYWHVTLPVALLMFGLWATWLPRRRRSAAAAAEERALVLLRRKTRGRDFATEQKQAAVSNRR